VATAVEKEEDRKDEEGSAGISGDEEEEDEKDNQLGNQDDWLVGSGAGSWKGEMGGGPTSLNTGGGEVVSGEGKSNGSLYS
jgi:hypothetical protein